MAISSSPNSRSNSSLRNSEANSPMRRSFSGNPIHTNPGSFVPATPANRPAEFSRTSSSRKEEKENDKDHETLKPSRARSVSKSSIRFMMPTISAASKTNPSPRKKLLADKNEPLRASLSFSDLKSPSDSIYNFTEKTHQRLEKGLDSKGSEITEDVLETPTNTNHLPKCPSHNFSESSDIKPIVGSNTKLFASSISPLDDDPSLRPYDPKTNYLSPRPQFLHYRPNPRLGLYYKKEHGTGKNNLEDSFLSESSSDTEVSEESEPENSQKESDNDSSVEAMNEISEKESEEASSIKGINEKLEKGSEDNSSVEASNENSEEVKENDCLVEGINEKSENEPEKDYSVQAIIEKFAKESKDASAIEVVSEIVESEVYEPEPITTSLSTPFSYKSSEEKKVIKSSFFTRRKVIPFLLVLLIAFLSLSYTLSSFSDSPVFDNLSSSEFYEKNFNGFTRNLKLWSDYSTSYVNELLIGCFSGGDKLDPLQFSNVTSMQEDPFVEVKRFEEIYEQDEVEPVFEDEDESQLDQNLENDIEREIIQPVASYLQNGTDFEKLCPEEAASEVIEGDYHISVSKTESSTAVNSFGDTFVKVDYDSEIESNTEVPRSGDDHLISYSKIETPSAYSGFGKIVAISLSEVWSLEKGDNTVSESVRTFHVDSEYDSKILDVVEIKEDDSLTSDSKIEPDLGNTSEIDASNSSKQYEAVTISFLAIALVAAPVLIYLKKQKSNTSISTVHIDPKSSKKTMKLNPTHQNYPPEVDLVLGEPCPSEMSSSYSKRGMGGTTNEASSQERRPKRISKRTALTSASEVSMSDSPSYGSFTTYERLPIKHGNRDDEVVTPVRRSSRIKKIQITSS